MPTRVLNNPTKFQDGPSMGVGDTIKLLLPSHVVSADFGVSFAVEDIFCLVSHLKFFSNFHKRCPQGSLTGASQCYFDQGFSQCLGPKWTRLFFRATENM